MMCKSRSYRGDISLASKAVDSTSACNRCRPAARPTGPVLLLVSRRPSRQARGSKSGGSRARSPTHERSRCGCWPPTRRKTAIARGREARKLRLRRLVNCPTPCPLLTCCERRRIRSGSSTCKCRRCRARARHHQGPCTRTGPVRTGPVHRCRCVLGALAQTCCSGRSTWPCSSWRIGRPASCTVFCMSGSRRRSAAEHWRSCRMAHSEARRQRL